MDSKINKINRDLVIGWLVIVGVLFVSYCGEVIKGMRTLPYLAEFMTATALPAFICLYLYKRNPYSKVLRYYIVGGYFFMYIFSMVTASTDLVFCYILPMLSLLVLYHQPRLILVTGIAALVVNLVSIVIKLQKGSIVLSNSKDVEIQLALLILCFAGSYSATRLYNDITRENNEYLRLLDEKKDQIQHMALQTISAIANTIDAKDEYTQDHSSRVSKYSAEIAREMGLSKEQIQNIRSVALLHDIGKIGVPDSVLNKPGKLTKEEYELMKQHTTIGGEILKDINMIEGIGIGARYHHERYDGKGYPEGLKGEEIPLIARIIAVADAYDAMTSNRVYRSHLDFERVINEIKNGAGSQFDADAANALLKLIEEKRLPVPMPDESSGVNTIISRVIEKREVQLQNELYIDFLTGVYSCNYGESLISESLSEKDCLMLFDIDSLHKVNESAGFVVGDAFIKTVAQCIDGMCENRITVRFSSDTFAVLCKGVVSEEDAGRLADRFFALIRLRKQEEPYLAELSVSVGITFSRRPSDSLRLLHEQANKALYMAKQGGGGKYEFYREGIYSTPIAVNADGWKTGIDLTQLIGALKEDRTADGGIYNVCPGADKAYRMLKEAENAQALMFTVSADSGAKITVEDRDIAISYLKRAAANVVDSPDNVIRYSSNQILLVLADMGEDGMKNLIARIMKDFYKMYSKRDVTISYDFAAVKRESAPPAVRGRSRA